MKSRLLGLSVLLPILATAQPWRPITTSEKFNFRLNTAAIISHVICMDSARLAGGDSVFYLNRVVRRCTGCPDTNYFLRNQPQFLLEEMVKLPGGDFAFRNPGSFLIRTLAEPGQSWIFDTAAALNAQVTWKGWQLVLGQWDSVKVITLSSGQVIKLSKEHGLIQFPVIGQSLVYSLDGIAGRNVGTLLPGFREIYNFQVGDVFQYDDYWMQYGVGYGGKTLLKLRILSRDSTPQGYTYEMEERRIFWSVSLIGSPGPVHHQYQLTTVTFSDSARSVCNHYPGQLIDDPFGNGYPGGEVSAASIVPDTGGIISRFAGSDEFPVCYTGTGDTLFPMLSAWEFSHKFSATLGEVWYKYAVFESYVENQLIGYVKNGDTTGIIYPDDSILQTVHQGLQDGELRVYPNPAKEKINIRMPGNGGISAVVELFSSNGLLVRKQAEPFTRDPVEIDVRGLPPGLYLLIVGLDGRMLNRKVTIGETP